MKKLPLLVLFLLTSFGVYAQEPVNILQKVNISEEFGNAIIGLDFNGPVSFTSMKLTNPFRIVLDFNDCKKGNSVKNTIKVKSEGIKEISITQMGSNDSPTLRVTILTDLDTEFNIEPTDNGINVRLSGVKLASANTAESSPNEPTNVVEVTPKQQEEVRPEPAPVVAETKPEPKPEPAPVVAETKPEPKPEPAPVVAEKSQEEYSPELEQKKEKKKVKFKEAPAMAASNESSQPTNRQEKKVRFKEAPAMAASNEEANRTEHISPPPRKKSPSGKNSLTWLGFQVSASGSRVFIKTIEEAEYSIKEKDDKTLVLEIYNTDIPKKNNRRPLDTSFFNSPVAYISPSVEGGAMKVVRIEIKLKQRVPFITKQESNALYVDFEGVN